MRFFSFFLLLACFAFAEEPLWVYLSWQNDPSSTMTVHWITPIDNENDDLLIKKDSEESWSEAEGSHVQIPDQDLYFVHSLELFNLFPDTVYEFRIHEKLYKFKTAPLSLNTPVSFAVGGDVYHDSIEAVEETNRMAASLDPLFVIIGGDIAYSRQSFGRKEDYKRWFTWLDSWQKTMVASDGRLIPIVPVIGNHDVSVKGLSPPSKAPAFYYLFSLSEERGYRNINFSNYLSLYLLDSHHTHKVDGKQALWLESKLKENKEMPYKFAAYHVPAYPSHRKYTTTESILIRKHWCPLFEQFKLTACFEHHDHLYKRTHPIKNEAIDIEGVLYIGDGCWGVSKPRKAKKAKFLEKTASERHIIFATLTSQKADFKVYNPKGVLLDEFVRLPTYE